MGYLMFLYSWDSRSLKKIITWILKSWVAEEIKKINYVKGYTLYDKNIKKHEEKIILILTKDQDRLMDFLSKNYQQLDRLLIN